MVGDLSRSLSEEVVFISSWRVRSAKLEACRVEVMIAPPPPPAPALALDLDLLLRDRPSPFPTLVSSRNTFPFESTGTSASFFAGMMEVLVATSDESPASTETAEAVVVFFLLFFFRFGGIEEVEVTVTPGVRVTVDIEREEEDVPGGGTVEAVLVFPKVFAELTRVGRGTEAIGAVMVEEGR